MFPNSPAAQEKGCPRGAFLGLCEEGLVVGVDQGSYTRSTLNKQYAVVGVQRLAANPSLATDATRLWQLVQHGIPKAPNGQMDVVISLWDQGMILRQHSASHT